MTVAERKILQRAASYVARMKHVWEVNQNADIFGHVPLTRGEQIVMSRLCRAGMMKRAWDDCWVYWITDAGLAAVAS